MRVSGISHGWTAAQDAYLIKNYAIKPLEEICNYLKKNPGTIYVRAGKLQLSRNKIPKTRLFSDMPVSTHKEVISDVRGPIDIIVLDKKSEQFLSKRVVFDDDPKPRWDEKPSEDQVLDQNGNPMPHAPYFKDVPKPAPGDAMQRFRQARLKKKRSR